MPLPVIAMAVAALEPAPLSTSPVTVPPTLTLPAVVWLVASSVPPPMFVPPYAPRDEL